MIFVTGGTGFLGAHLLVLLAKDEKPLKALKRKSGNTSNIEKLFHYKFRNDWEKFYSRIQWVEGDIMDVTQVEAAMQGVDEVYHCAALVTLREKGREEVIRTAETGTENMVNTALALKVNKFCHVSSVASLGPSEKGDDIDENCFERFSYYNAPYAIGKHLAELQVWRAAAEGLNTVIVNPSIILGPWSNLYAGSMMLFSHADAHPYFYINGAFGFVDVTDVVQCMRQLMAHNKWGESFILSSANMGFKEVFSQIAGCLGKPVPTYQISRRTLAIYRIIYNLLSRHTISPSMVKHASRILKFKNDKIIQALGYRFIPVNETIRATSQFYRGERRK